MEFGQNHMDFEVISNDEMIDVCLLLNTQEEEDEVVEPSQNEEMISFNSTDMRLVNNPSSMIFLSENDSEFVNLHLFMAYCEAMEKKRMVLADAIIKRIIKKVKPTSRAINERLLYYLFQTHNKQLDYFKRECMKNFRVCFTAFYKFFPYEMFAHFAANALILNTICHETKTIHIYDFDIGSGVQWSSLIMASQLQEKEVRITSISWREDPFKYFTFEETKKRLYLQARNFGLKLTLDELELSDIKKMKEEISNKREYIHAFNCMVSLPHMMNERSRKDAMEFKRVAEQFACEYGHNVVITFGDGNINITSRNQDGFCSIFEGNMTRYKALLESMDHIFPKHLEEAKIAMECLFVAPFVSEHAWIQNWEVQKELQWESVLEGFEVINEEIIFESKLMVREGDSLYQVTADDHNKNEITLLWNNHPLVRVSCWKS